MFLAWFFTLAAIFASFGIGNMVQANSLSETMEMNFNVAPWVSGLVIAVVTFFVLIGGVKSISNVAGAIVPIMIVAHIGVQLWILLTNIGGLGEAFATIFHGAFNGTAAAGGFTGALVIAAIQFGLARGLFSNESGMGSAAIAAGAAQTSHPTRQGLVSMTQTFIDTIILVTMTGLVITVTKAYEIPGPDGAGLTGVNLTSTAFNIGMGTESSNLGGILVAICLVLFASTTLWGWSYYGERVTERAVGTKAILPFRLLWVVMSFVGATIPLTVVWTFSDIMNGLMVIPNLIGILILSNLIARETKAYLKFDPKLVATQDQVHEALANEPGYQAWRAEETRLDGEVAKIKGAIPATLLNPESEGAKR